jgi:hypothetical protein
MMPIRVLRMRKAAASAGSTLVQWLGSKTFTYNSTSAQVVSLTDLLDAAGSSPTLLQNDYVVVTFVIPAQSDIASAGMLPTTSGYTAAHTDLYSDDSNDTNFQVSYKKMGVSPDTSVTMPAGLTGRGHAVHIMALRNVSGTTPLDVTPTTATGINTGIPDPPAITPTTTGALITVHGGGSATGDLAVYTNPGDLSAVTNQFLSAAATSTINKGMIGVGMKTDWLSGAFDPSAFGGTSTSTLNSWAGVSIAWRPGP